MNNYFSENIEDIDMICLDCKSDIEFSIDKEKMEIKYKCSNCEPNQKEPIPLELYMQKMKDISKEINKCSECNNKGLLEKALFICLNCRNIVCEKCKDKHFQNGKCFIGECLLIKKDEKKIKCFHHNKLYKFYCFDCKKNICEDCISKCLQKKHSKFENIENIDNKLVELNSVIKNTEKEKNEAIKNKENAINELNNKLIENIKKKKEDYENKLRENISERNKEVSDIENEIIEHNEKINEIQNEIIKLMELMNEENAKKNELFDKNKKAFDNCEKNNNICLEQFNKAEKELKENNVNEIQKINEEYDLNIKNKNILIESYKIIEKINRKNKANIFYIKSISNILEGKNKNSVKKIKELVDNTSSYNCYDNNNFIVFPSINNKSMVVYVYNENKIMYIIDDSAKLLSESEEKIILLKHCHHSNSQKDYLLVAYEGGSLKIWSWDGQIWEKEKNEITPESEYEITSAGFIEWSNELYIIIADSWSNINIYPINNNKTVPITTDDIKSKVFCIYSFIDIKKNVYVVMGHEDICRSYILENNKLKLYKEYYNDDKSNSQVNNIIIKEEKEIVKLIVCTPAKRRIRIFNFHKEENEKELLTIKIGEEDKNLIMPLSMCLWNERTLIVGCSNNEIRKVDLIETNTDEKVGYHTTPVISLQKIKLGNKDILFSQGENEKIIQWEFETSLYSEKN